MSNATAMRLSDLPAGRSARVTAFEGGSGFRERLAGMGLSIGSRVAVVQTSTVRGPLLVAVGDTRLGMGRGMAAKVVVAPDPETEEQALRRDSSEEPT